MISCLSAGNKFLFVIKKSSFQVPLIYEDLYSSSYNLFKFKWFHAAPGVDVLPLPKMSFSGSDKSQMTDSQKL